jgi:hypothetical protein
VRATTQDQSHGPTLIDAAAKTWVDDGSFRTTHLVPKPCDALRHSDIGTLYRSRLDPPPDHSPRHHPAPVTLCATHETR